MRPTNLVFAFSLGLPNLLASPIAGKPEAGNDGDHVKPGGWLNPKGHSPLQGPADYDCDAHPDKHHYPSDFVDPYHGIEALNIRRFTKCGGDALQIRRKDTYHLDGTHNGRKHGPGWACYTWLYADHFGGFELDIGAPPHTNSTVDPVTNATAAPYPSYAGQQRCTVTLWEGNFCQGKSFHVDEWVNNGCMKPPKGFKQVGSVKVRCGKLDWAVGEYDEGKDL